MQSIPHDALRFNEQLYTATEHTQILSRLQSEGLAYLKGVYVRDSVDAFRQQLLDLVESTEKGPGDFCAVPQDHPFSILPALAPRIRQAVQRSMSPTSPPLAVLDGCGWITRATPPQTSDENWHKDRDAEGLYSRFNRYPYTVSVSSYFEDADEQSGVTEFIPGSHLDVTLSPYRGARRLCPHPRKEDAIIWDPRMWHRGPGRSAPGRRVMAICNFHLLPTEEEAPRRMGSVHRSAWINATTPADRLYFGGLYEPE
ncbi:MAG: phytanoyl-CoA dioxygenase family protein [Verrucomicrobia bacterium]|nr:phytanoyl-CoA dioxygenase family protein [Verrucomicrobiota bacterium]